MKFTKTELRFQQLRLNQLLRYLPTLQLKKSMLEQEVMEATTLLQQLAQERSETDVAVQRFIKLLSDSFASQVLNATAVKEIITHMENIAGVEVPFFDEMVFEKETYSFFDTPVWFDMAIIKLRLLLTQEMRMTILRTRINLLKKELKEVSIRLNLFEKVLIPRATENIKKIKIFLGDQQLAAVAQAKIAKKKIEKRSQTESAMEEIA